MTQSPTRNSVFQHIPGRLPINGYTAAATSAKDTALARQTASAAEKKGAVDPIIQQLLKNARSEAVRQEFLSTPQEEYTSKHDIEVLVSSYQHQQQHTAYKEQSKGVTQYLVVGLLYLRLVSNLLFRKNCFPVCTSDGNVSQFTWL